MIALEDVKAWLKIPITNTTHDEALEALEARIVEWIERELRWYFGHPREKVEWLNGTGGPTMFLNQPPVDGTTVTLVSRSGSGSEWTALAVEDFELAGRALHIVSGAYWVRGTRNYRATYQEGFVDPPGDIVQVVMDLLSAVWNQRGKEGYSSERIGDYSYSFGTINAAIGNVPRWKQILETWRRGRVR